jgi:hypothetical protein
MYHGWAIRDVHLVRQNRGLPQGTNSSGVVANYFLMPFDEELHRYAGTKNLRWYRYNDDMRLLGASRENVRLGLRTIGQHLGRLNLIQQGSKTKILVGSQARRELFDNRPQKIEAIIKRVQAKKTLKPRSKASILMKLDRMLATVKDVNRKQDSTVLAMLYSAYRVLENERLLRRWKNDYLREPTRARTILSYVSCFMHRRGQCSAVTAMLNLQRRAATDWEIVQFIRFLRHMRSLPIEAVNVLRFLSQSKTANWYVRQQAILTIGWFCLSSEARALSQKLNTEWDDEVRRAILTILFLLPHDDERKLLRQASRELSPKVSRMANFLLELRRNPVLAQQMLKQFYGPNDVFFADNFWKLYQLRWVRDTNTKQAADRVLTRSKATLTSNYQRRHLKALASL